MSGDTSQVTLPSGAEAAFETIQNQALAMIDKAWPVLIAVVGAFILIKVFRKVVTRAV